MPVEVVLCEVGGDNLGRPALQGLVDQEGEAHGARASPRVLAQLALALVVGVDPGRHALGRHVEPPRLGAQGLDGQRDLRGQPVEVALGEQEVARVEAPHRQPLTDAAGREVGQRDDLAGGRPDLQPERRVVQRLRVVLSHRISARNIGRTLGRSSSRRRSYCSKIQRHSSGGFSPRSGTQKDHRARDPRWPENGEERQTARIIRRGSPWAKKRRVPSETPPRPARREGLDGLAGWLFRDEQHDVWAAEKACLLAPDIQVGLNRTHVIVFGPRDFSNMSPEERIRACFQHCALNRVTSDYMTNQSLRERFRLPEDKSSQVRRGRRHRQAHSRAVPRSSLLRRLGRRSPAAVQA
jgi:hypothetical protein